MTANAASTDAATLRLYPGYLRNSHIAQPATKTPPRNIAKQ